MSTSLPSLPTQRTWEPVIDQHETWLAVNPKQGCPKGCNYCYLKDRGQTQVKPVELATPGQTAELLAVSPYYHPKAILALYTCTDALATPSNRAHLIGLLDALVEQGMRNPICLITKCALTDDVLEAICRTRDAGAPVIVYLSYSGLDGSIERGIDHAQVRDNFPRLRMVDVPVIHYWRPLMPQNAAPDVIRGVLDWACQFATCSVAVGLKIKPGSRRQMSSMWPELRDPELPLESADAVWPRGAWEILDSLPTLYPGHPIYRTNSCALAYTLGRPDSHQVHGTEVCEANHCPMAQRKRCLSGDVAHGDAESVQRRLAWLGVPDVPPVRWDARTSTATVEGPLALRDRNNAAQSLGVAVKSEPSENERYWAGRFGGAEPFVID